MPKLVINKAAPKSRSKRILAALRRMPKLSASRSERMYELIEKGKLGKRSRAEDRELRSIMLEMDQRSFWNLAEAIEAEATSDLRQQRKTG